MPILTKKQIDTRRRLAKEKHIATIVQYQKEPNFCLQCRTVIPLKEEHKSSVAEARRKKFCSRSCAAIYNNRKFPKRVSRLEPIGNCEDCGKQIEFTKRKAGGYNVRKFCDDCRLERRRRKLPQCIKNTTLGQLIKLFGRLQARTYITRDARRTYLESKGPSSCIICKFDFCFDVAHIKPVNSFSEESFISEINALSNLIALCPNHHRLYDAGITKLPMVAI